MRNAIPLLTHVYMFAVVSATATSVFAGDQTTRWPMAGGPAGTWATRTREPVVTQWSVTRGEHVKWQTELPEGGQSGIAVWGDRLFLTVNKPLPSGSDVDDAISADIVGLCLNAHTGKILWSVQVPGTKQMPYAGLFSDNTSPTPVTDGERVWFVNAGGRMTCCDLAGKVIWSTTFEARTRHNAKQCEPMLIDGQLIYVAMRDKDDPKRRPMKAKKGDRKSSSKLWPWTYLRAYDAMTGKPAWAADAATSIHNTPRHGQLDGRSVIFHARGGGHQPPETPYGFSLTQAGAGAGKTLWNAKFRSGQAYVVSHFDENYAYAFDKGDLCLLAIQTGKIVKRIPLFDRVDLRLWNNEANTYDLHRDARAADHIQPLRDYPTNQTNLLVGDHYLFMSHEGHCIVRVNVKTGKVEYLQVPLQVSDENRWLWEKHVPADTKNARGIVIAADKRAKRDGWGHVTSASPIAVNNIAFFSTMLGTTYVVDVTATAFNRSALLNVNDLGPVGKTWSLSAPSFANDNIYHRSLKHIVCIGK